jgi:hypothetical protein
MRAIFLKSFLVFASCLVGFLAIEILLRLFFPIYFTGGSVGSYQYDEKLGTRLKPNIHWLKTTDYQQEIYTNRIGTTNFHQHFDGHPILIFAIGDSFTQGIGLPSDATYPFQLDLIMNMHNDGKYLSRYAVVNLGSAGYGGEQELLSLLMYKEILGTPNYILYFGCENDYMDDILFKNRYRHQHLVDGNPYVGKLLKPLQWFANGTETGKRAKIALGTLKRNSYMKDDHQEQEIEKSSNIAELEESVLNKLLASSKDLNALLIVSWSSSPDDSSSSYQWLKEWAKEKNVAFADWHPMVESVLKAIPGIPITNPHSGGHYRTWVNTMIAEAFAEQIRKGEQIH